MGMVPHGADSITATWNKRICRIPYRPRAQGVREPISVGSRRRTLLSLTNREKSEFILAQITPGFNWKSTPLKECARSRSRKRPMLRYPMRFNEI